MTVKGFMKRLDFFWWGYTVLDCTKGITSAHSKGHIKSKAAEIKQQV